MVSPVRKLEDIRLGGQSFEDTTHRGVLESMIATVRQLVSTFPLE